MLKYAVGDIHGRFDLLVIALKLIKQHADGREHVVIFLGDYVDRGPDSFDVVELLMSLSAICLRGNHEQIMIDANGSGNDMMWVMNGGRATIQSYGGDVALMRKHIEWMKSLPYYVEDDLRIFVHAGLFPGKSMNEQIPEEMMWIRDRFLRATDFEKHIVHGHTHTHDRKATEEVELLPHRTNLDTAGFHTGKLAIAVFNEIQAQPVEILYARADR